LEKMVVRTDQFGSRDELLDGVRLNLRSITFSPKEAIEGEIGRVGIGGGTGSAVIRSDVIKEALGPAAAIAGNRLDDLPLSIDGRTLVAGPVRIDLPLLTNDMTYSSVRVVGDAIRLRFTIERTSLEFRGVREGLVLDL
jgi:hypothetical protein